MISTPSGLQYEDTTVGTGAEAKAGQHVHVHYTGWLYNDGVQGAKFDSSRDRNDPFAFSLGAGQVIKGWDEGVAGMKIGGQRTLIIPAALGYGARGAGGVIPPNATLKFDVELLATTLLVGRRQAAQPCLRAVTSISIFIRGSARTAEIIVAAEPFSPKCWRSTGEQAGKSCASGRM